jgi:hypothetical protein
MKKSYRKNGRRNKRTATISHRDFLKYTGAAGERQLENPLYGLIHNLGGFPAMNVCSISIIGKYK